MPTEAYISLQTVGLLAPEIVLIGAAMLILLGGAFRPARTAWSFVGGSSIIIAAMLLSQSTPGAAIRGPLAPDLMSVYVRGLTLLLGGLFVLLSARTSSQRQGSDYLGTLLLALAGVMITAAARELVLLFVGLELISIPTYVLLYLGRRNASSQADEAAQEATTKYFFLSIMSSALLLYGFSFLYGAAGSTELAIIREKLVTGTGGKLSLLALLLVFAGLGFRIAAVPFHFYAPDVYQGTTNGNAGLLSVLPKIAGFAALVRIVAVSMPDVESYGWRLALVLAVLTMTLGNVTALWQDNVRRLLAYSSIAHAGYMLIGLAAALAMGNSVPAESVADGRLDGVGAMLFYLLVYSVATVGTFATLTYLGRSDREVDGIDELAGVGRTNPIAGISLALFMFSLAGIPLLAGFWGKFALFGSAVRVASAEATPGSVQGWFWGLAIVGALNAAIAAAYYLRVIGVAYFRPSLSTPGAQGGGGAAAAMAICAVLVVLLGIAPGRWLAGSNAASQSAQLRPAADGREAVAGYGQRTSPVELPARIER